MAIYIKRENFDYLFSNIAQTQKGYKLLCEQGRVIKYSRNIGAFLEKNEKKYLVSSRQNPLTYFSDDMVFDDAIFTEKGLVIVTNNKKKGIFNIAKSTWLLACDYDRILNGNNNHFIVHSHGVCFIFDADSGVKTDLCEKITCYPSYYEVRRGDFVGCLTSDLKVILPCVFSNIEKIDHEEKFLVACDNLHGKQTLRAIFDIKQGFISPVFGYFDVLHGTTFFSCVKITFDMDTFLSGIDLSDIEEDDFGSKYAQTIYNQLAESSSIEIQSMNIEGKVFYNNGGKWEYKGNLYDTLWSLKPDSYEWDELLKTDADLEKYEDRYVGHQNGLVVVGVGDKIGIINDEGNLTIPCKYDLIAHNENDLFEAYQLKAFFGDWTGKIRNENVCDLYDENGHLLMP